ncbi:MAG: nitroreductase family deazaflavin-dependent oxidoreductase [Caldilineaceae bacterium]|nr:nitroreductase family deazaflavin-dependent oxidoreductase [Caldilineaceae bacterium]
MNEAIQKALQEDTLVDITPTGRKTGEPRKFEIMLRRHGGKYYIAGQPERKGWYANMVANPEIILYLKQSAQADLPATAHPVLDAATRRELFQAFFGDSEMMDDLEKWIEAAKLIEIRLS